MKLAGVEKNGSWLFSQWNLTYRVGWSQICSAVWLIYNYTTDPEIIVGGTDGETKVEIKNADDIMSIEESGNMTIRGMSDIIKVPLSITFFNQLDLVRVTVACANAEFAEADYKKFNLSMCQFLDSAEIAMYR